MIYQHVYKLWLLRLLNDYGNFKEAANHARMTQSAVSQNLSALEKALQKSLVIRERGGVRLTDEGEILLRQMTPVLDILKDIDNLQGSGEKLSGRIKIGAYESIAVQLFHYLYGTLEVKHPELKIEVVTGRSHYLVDQIRKGHIDLAFVINGKKENKIQVENIAAESLGLYTSSRNPFLEIWNEEKDEKPVVKLATMTPSQQEGYPLFYKRFLKAIPYDHKVAMQSDSFETLRAVAEETNLVSVLPHRVARASKKQLTCLWQGAGEKPVGEHFISFIWRENTDKGMVDLLSGVARQVF